MKSLRYITDTYKSIQIVPPLVPHLLISFPLPSPVGGPSGYVPQSTSKMEITDEEDQKEEGVICVCYPPHHGTMALCYTSVRSYHLTLKPYGSYPPQVFCPSKSRNPLLQIISSKMGYLDKMFSSKTPFAYFGKNLVFCMETSPVGVLDPPL